MTKQLWLQDIIMSKVFEHTPMLILMTIKEFVEFSETPSQIATHSHNNEVPAKHHCGYAPLSSSFNDKYHISNCTAFLEHHHQRHRSHQSIRPTKKNKEYIQNDNFAEAILYDNHTFDFTVYMYSYISCFQHIYIAQIQVGCCLNLRFVALACCLSIIKIKLYLYGYISAVMLPILFRNCAQ